MTKMQELNDDYDERSNQITEDVKEGKKKLSELGFSDTVKGEVFAKVFKEYWLYQINEIKLMSVDKWEKAQYHMMQFLIRFEDDSDFFVYVEVK